MAGSVVSAVVERVVELLANEGTFLYRVDDEVESVVRELQRMECFLKDADAKRKTGDDRVKNWVKEVREAAYRAEDLVESFVLHAELRRRRRTAAACPASAQWLVCLPCDLFRRHRFGEEIQRLKGRIKEISESRATYGIENLAAGAVSYYVDESVRERRRVALHTESDMVGMEDEQRKILALLRDDEVKRRAVISIVGMGGLGKTTLAKKVYNTFKLESTGRFECVAWIDVSQHYDNLELLKEMATKVLAVTGDDAKIMSRDEVEKKLYERLRGKKYLVVMDDVWDNNAWGVFNAHLPDADNGSRVLITSRSLQVAKAADPGIPPYELRFLNDDESWELFSKKVYPHQDPDATGCTGELRELGKQIAKKCGGLPLAIVVLGGMLSSKPKTAIVWQRLSEVIRWRQSEDGRLCMEILALSYDDLPYRLKYCFLYLGSFPEDYEISVEKLTRLWIAEGFVLPADGESPEQTADDYLEELIQRCLVQVVERSSYGCVDRCRIHDLLHDLSIAEAKEIGFFECHRNADELASGASSSSSSTSSVRRLSLHRGMEDYLSRHRYSTPNLRTLLGFKFEKPMELRLRGFELLRVIDLEGAKVETLPEEIGNAVHLRYLGLRSTRIDSLPSSVGRLSRLQILDAAETPISKIPSSLWRIRSLRHLYVPTTVQPPEVLAAGTLMQLHVLDKPRAGSWISQGLEGLTNLHKLGIVSIMESHQTPLSSSLESFTRLNSLELEGELIPPCALTLPGSRRLYEIRLFGRLGKPPRPYSSDQLSPNLTKLHLYRTRLDQDPMALLEQLRELRILILLRESYTGKEMTCSSGGFPSLQVLRMEYLEEVEQWTVESGAMPRLQNLRINGCRRLSMLPHGLQDMLDLREFTLRNMSEEFFLRVKEQGEDWQKIQHVRSININLKQIK